MEYVKSMLRSLKIDRAGVTALEYGLIAAVLAVTVIGGFQLLGNSMSTQFTNVGAKLSVQ